MFSTGPERAQFEICLDLLNVFLACEDSGKLLGHVNIYLKKKACIIYMVRYRHTDVIIAYGMPKTQNSGMAF